MEERCSEKQCEECNEDSDIVVLSAFIFKGFDVCLVGF